MDELGLNLSLNMELESFRTYSNDVC